MGFQHTILTYAPEWMLGKRGKILLQSVGAYQDERAEVTLRGRMAAIPYAGGARTAVGDLLQCEPDALSYHARDRGITLYPTEPTASKRVRLSRWRQLHARRGTHRGEMEHVQPYFLGADGTGTLPTIRIVHQSGSGKALWHTLSPSGVYSVHLKATSNWNFDGAAESWARWWAIIYTTGVGLLSDTLWNDGSNWDGGQYWDGLSPSVAADIVAMFLDWKSAHSQCAGIILARSNSDFDPTATATTGPDGRTTLPIGNWGHLTDPTTGLPTRLGSATFLLDRYH